MIRLIQKIGTAMRGGASEALEAVVDANALRIFEQEIREAEDKLRESKQHLAVVMADKLKLSRELKVLQQQIRNQEALVRQQLEAGNEAAAMQTAEAIADKEARLEQMQTSHERLGDYETRLMTSLKSSSQKLDDYRAELRMARATQHSQQVIGKLSSQPNAYSDKFAQMQESAQRIRQTQSEFEDQMQAMQEIDDELNGEIKADKSERANAVLDRIKAQNAA